MNETIFLGGCPVIRPEGIYLDGQRVIRFGLAERTAGVADIGCGDVDVDQWKARNRVRLYPSQRMRWLFAVSKDGREGMTETELRAVFETTIFPFNPVFLRWFSQVALNPGDVLATQGKIDNTKMLAYGTKEEMLDVAARSGLVIAERAENLPGISTLVVRQPKVYALVEFDYRSIDTSMPWPVYNGRTLANKWCPLDCDVALSVTFQQTTDAKNIPKETSIANPSTWTPLPSSEEVLKIAGEAAKGAVGDATKVLTTVAIVGAVAGAGWLLYKYAPRPEPPRRFSPEPRLPPGRSWR